MTLVPAIGKTGDQEFALCIAQKRAALLIADKKSVSLLLDEVSLRQDDDVIGHFKCQSSGDQGKYR